MRVVVLAGMVAVMACGPIDQGGGVGSNGGPADAGSSPDGGTVAGPGSPDAGGGGVALDCTGVMPANPGAPTTVAVQHGGGDVCFNATADQSGNVAAEAHPSSMGNAWTGRWQIWSAAGEARGSFSSVGGDVFGQQEGFQSTQGNALVAWSASGQEVRRSRLDDKCSHEAFYSATGGSLVLDRCGSKVKASRFDAAGAQAASTDDIAEGAAAAGIVDAQGRALIVVASGGSSTARWYDGGLKSASAPFAIRASASGAPVLRPIIGGGAAVQVNGAWVALVRSGVGSADDPPAWLAAHPNFDLQIIRKNGGYALIPRSGASPRNALELFSGGGERCGAVTFPTDGLSMGPEGTVIGSSGEGGCTHEVWSGLLR
jgi:hypothetical protein